MTNKEIGVIMKLKDEVTKQVTVIQSRFKQFADSFKQHWLAGSVAITASIVAMKKFGDALISVQKDLIDVSAKFERWQVQIRTFTKNAQEASQVIKDLIEFSVKTPFTPEEVIQAGKLLKPLEELGFEMKDLLAAAGNAATAFGLSMEQSSLQIVRSFTSGIGAADLFRDRGVRSFIEINKGIDLTKLSLEDMRKVLLETLTTGTIGDAMKREALTFQGLVSTMQGEWMLFKQVIGEPVFEKIKMDLRAVLQFIQESKKEGGDYNRVVTELQKTFSDLFDASREFFLNGIVFGGQLVDIINEMQVILKGAQAAWVAFIGGIINLTAQLGNIPGIGSKIVDKEALDAALVEVQADLVRLNEEILQAQERANIDYSMQLEQRLAKFREILQQQKALASENEIEMERIVGEGVKQQTSEVQKAYQTMFSKMKDELQKAGTAYDVAFNAMKKSTDALANRVGSAFADMIVEGKNFAKSMEEAFKDMAKTFIAEVAKMIVKWLAFLALKKAASLFGGFFHEGGVVMHRGGVIRAHGGLAIDEVPIIAQRGEGILSRRGLRNLGGPEALRQLNRGSPFLSGSGGVEVNIEINNPVITGDEIAEEFGNMIAGKVAMSINREVERI